MHVEEDVIMAFYTSEWIIITKIKCLQVKDGLVYSN